MDFRHNPRVFRAWRVERLKSMDPGKVNRKDLTGHGKRRVPEYTRKGRS